MSQEKENAKLSVEQHEAAPADVLAHVKWLHYCLREAGHCIDGGKCHHECSPKGECWRQNGCVPLTGSRLSDDWKLPVAQPEPPVAGGLVCTCGMTMGHTRTCAAFDESMMRADPLAQPVAAAADERAAFEAWVETLDHSQGIGCDIKHGHDGAEDAAWVAWQARASSPNAAGADWYDRLQAECTADHGAYDENAPIATRLRWWVPKSARHGTIQLEDDLREAADVLSRAPRTDVAGAAPIDMLLFCPKCGVQHVDAPETERGRLISSGPNAGRAVAPKVTWENPPHRSHLCHACGTIWRPADVPTNGVASIGTQGKADTWTSADAAAAPGSAIREQIARALHYPACWDTAAYPTLESAAWEAIASAKLGCSACDAAPADAQAVEAVVIPVGYALVPIEPTDEMITAGIAKGDSEFYGDALVRAEVRSDYQAMIAAATPLVRYQILTEEGEWLDVPQAYYERFKSDATLTRAIAAAPQPPAPASAPVGLTDVLRQAREELSQVEWENDPPTRITDLFSTIDALLKGDKQ